MEDTEKQLWEILKHIPGLNVAYGSVRCIVYVVRNDDYEATTSAVAAAKGAVQTAVLSAGIVTAPVTIPLVTGGAISGIAAKSVSDTVEIIVFFVTNSDQFLEKENDQVERMAYDKIKSVAGVGALYSAFRIPIYLLKRNKQESVESGVNFLINSGNTAMQVGVSMIPNIDEQLRKLIEKTSYCAIKYLVEKMGISCHNFYTAQGAKTLANVENSRRIIIEATTTAAGKKEKASSLKGMGLSEQNILPLVQNGEKIHKKAEHENKIKTKRSFPFVSWCCCCCKRSNARTRVEPVASHSAPISGINEDTTLTSIDGENNGHLIVLIE